MGLFSLLSALTLARNEDASWGDETSEPYSQRRLFWKRFRESRSEKALKSLYSTSNGDTWTSKEGWLTDVPYCEWEGVTCKGRVVTGLDLSGVGMTGPIPMDSLLKLNFLKTLNLSGNSLTSSISDKFFRLFRLEELDLSGNQLTSSIPGKIGLSLKLNKLNLSDNNLTGTIPSFMGLMLGLEELQLQKNDGLTGGMAREVCALHASWAIGSMEKFSGETQDEIIQDLLDLAGGLIPEELPEFLDFIPQFLESTLGSSLPDFLANSAAFTQLLKMFPSARLEIVSADCNIEVPCTCCSESFQPCCYNDLGVKNCTESRSANYLKDFFSTEDSR